MGYIRGRRVLGTEWILVADADIKGVAITSFFFARSPEAPSMTRMVFSCISREVDMLFQVWHADSQCNWMCRVIKK